MLNESDIAAALTSLPGWRHEGAALVKEFEVEGGFSAAVAFVARIATAADEADHHPDVAIAWNRVTLTWSTHSAGGLTQRDVAMAQRSDAIAARGTV